MPKSYCTAAGYRLGEWVSGQRSKKDGRLSEDRRQRLAAVEGWVWDAPDAAWEDGFEALTAYVQAEGSARVPKSYCTAVGYRLGAWVGKRRSQQDSLSADRRERLEGVRGWVWDPFTADWEDGFEALTAYVQAEGHARVPYPYRTAAGYRLGQWVGKRRSQQDSLSADRRERLEGVRGWVWDPFTADWEDGFEALTAYVQAEGSARVPQSYRTAAGYRLGTWVRVQRRQQDSMSADRRERLEAVDGWVWDAQDYDAAWDKGFEHLTTYVQAEGSARVPQSYCTAAGYRLGLWVAKRRSQQDSLSADRRQRLEAVDGWVWDTLDAAWDKGFEHLTTYVQAEGSARVPKSYCTAAGYRLGTWVSFQRNQQDSLSAERRQRLEAVDGWVWDPFAADWEKGLAQLTAYVQAEGSARVPQSYRTAEGYRLGQWVSVQRSRKDSLSADRRERLKALKGWVWKAELGPRGHHGVR